MAVPLSKLTQSLQGAWGTLRTWRSPQINFSRCHKHSACVTVTLSLGILQAFQAIPHEFFTSLPGHLGTLHSPSSAQ